jgi:hypothetical protein
MRGARGKYSLPEQMIRYKNRIYSVNSVLGLHSWLLISSYLISVIKRMNPHVAKTLSSL